MTGHAAGLVGAGGAVAAVDFRDEITVGSIIIGAVVIVIAGLFTIRAKIANVWREEAEGERAAKERVKTNLIAERADRAEFEKTQQELRHELKNEVVGLRTQLEVMEARTDLTAALESIQAMNEQTVVLIASQVSEARVVDRQASEIRDAQTHTLLEEIRDRLPAPTDTRRTR